MFYRTIWIYLALLLSSCASFVHQQVLSTKAIQAVEDDVKRQVSVYVSQQNARYGSDGSLIDPPRTFCGSGLVDYDIKQVKIDLLTTLETTEGAGITVANVPVSGVSIGGGFSTSLDTTNTQELIHTSDVVADGTFVYRRSPDERPAPLATVMNDLRDALLASAKVRNRICFRDTVKPPALGGAASKDGSADSNTFKIAITIINDNKGNLSVGLAPIAISLTGEAKTSTGNTVTFTFAPHDFTKLRPPRPYKCRPGERGHGCANQYSVPIPARP